MTQDTSLKAQTKPGTRCPSCSQAMQVHVLPSTNSANGGLVELDLCFTCQGMWFDPQENLKIAPAGVAALFKLLHEHRTTDRTPLAAKLGCPHCKSSLNQGFDVVRSGRYITYRCASGHGRFSAFSSFMIEKGFVRQLSRPEIDDIANRVGVISCTCCGAPVDLRKDHACPHCRSAFSLLDPQAVEKALQGYAKAVSIGPGVVVPDLADALTSMERDRERARRENRPQTGKLYTPDNDGLGFDLFSAGLGLVVGLLAN